MKKVYTAPKIYFESFTMSTNIAGDCEFQDINAARNTCSYDSPIHGNNLFVDNSVLSVCTNGVPDGYGDICYYQPSENTNLFNS